MKTITNQEIFDAAWQAFIVEGRAASTDGGSCQYRGPKGAKCAIGLCIPDELYHPDMEGLGPQDVEEDFFDIDFEDTDLAGTMQAELHDDIKMLLGKPEHSYEVRDLYTEFAEQHGLDIPEG